MIFFTECDRAALLSAGADAHNAVDLSRGTRKFVFAGSKKAAVTEFRSRNKA
jgi:hypothetical protein